jgi:ABC-type molybdate transport system substrate-binding protein
MPGRILVVAAFCLLAMIDATRAEQLHVLAAGSLREALGEIGSQYRKATGVNVIADFGPSGVLRERIEKGERADLFASADVGHPLKLLEEGLATRVAMFARNKLCGFAVPAIGLTTANFVDRLLDPTVKLGTSTPKADPAGDYTWAMFHKIDALRPGSYAILDKKAQQIVGGPTNNAPVGGKDAAATALATGRVDLFIGYCLPESGLGIALCKRHTFGDVGRLLGLGLYPLGIEVIVQQRRTRLHCRLDVDDVRQHLVLDLDQIERLRRDDR